MVKEGNILLLSGSEKPIVCKGSIISSSWSQMSLLPTKQSSGGHQQEHVSCYWCRSCCHRWPHSLHISLRDRIYFLQAYSLLRVCLQLRIQGLKPAAPAIINNDLASNSPSTLLTIYNLLFQVDNILAAIKTLKGSMLSSLHKDFITELWWTLIQVTWLTTLQISLQFFPRACE